MLGFVTCLHMYGIVFSSCSSHYPHLVPLHLNINNFFFTDGIELGSVCATQALYPELHPLSAVLFSENNNHLC